MTEKESHFLNSLRSWGLIVVLLAHAVQVFISPYWDSSVALQDWPILYYIVRRGPAYAVMVFFSISGLLIYYSFIENIKRHGYFRIRYYFTSRFLRIYPPLLVCLAIMLLFHFLLAISGVEGKEDFTNGDELYVARDHLAIIWRDYLGAGLLINTVVSGFNSPVLNGPLWSIAHEFWFYVAAIPFMWLIIKSWVLAVGYFALTYYLYVCSYVDEWWFYGWSVWVSAFLMTHISRTAPRIVFYAITFVCACTVFWLWSYILYNSHDSYYDYRSYYPGGMLLSVMLPFILQRLKGQQEKNLYTVIMSKIADCSYSAYLIHFPIYLMVFVYTNLLISEWHQRLIVIIGALFISLAVAYVLAFYLEDKQRIKTIVNKIA